MIRKFYLTDGFTEIDCNTDHLFLHEPEGLGRDYTNNYFNIGNDYISLAQDANGGELEFSVLFNAGSGRASYALYRTFGKFVRDASVNGTLKLIYETGDGQRWYRDIVLIELSKTELGGVEEYLVEKITFDAMTIWYQMRELDNEDTSQTVTQGAYGKTYVGAYTPQTDPTTEFLVDPTMANSNFATAWTYSARYVDTFYQQYATRWGYRCIVQPFGEHSGISPWDEPAVNAYSGAQIQANTNSTAHDGATACVYEFVFTAAIPGVYIQAQYDEFRATLNGNAGTVYVDGENLDLNVLFNGQPHNVSIVFPAGITWTGTPYLYLYVALDGTTTQDQQWSFELSQAHFGERYIYQGTTIIGYTYAQANGPNIAAYAYNARSTAASENVFHITSDEESPIEIIITGVTEEALQAGWSIIDSAGNVKTQRYLTGFDLLLTDKFVESSFPRDRRSNIERQGVNGLIDVQQYQDITANGYLTIPKGDSTLIFSFNPQTFPNADVRIRYRDSEEFI